MTAAARSFGGVDDNKTYSILGKTDTAAACQVVQRAACSVPPATCALQSAAFNMQRATSNLRRSRYNLQHAACDVEHADGRNVRAACDAQPSMALPSGLVPRAPLARRCAAICGAVSDRFMLCC